MLPSLGRASPRVLVPAGVLFALKVEYGQRPYYMLLIWNLHLLAAWAEVEQAVWGLTVFLSGTTVS
jgi:hypothetical protein